MDKMKVYVLAQDNGKFQIYFEDVRKNIIYGDCKKYCTFEDAERLAKKYCNNLWFGQSAEYISMR